MAEIPLEPRVVALLLAEDAFHDDRGRTHVHGIFDSITASKFPMFTSFKVFVAFKGTKSGIYQSMIRLVDSLDNKLAETELITFEVTEFKGHNLFINLKIDLPSPQLYNIKVFVDGIERLEVPLLVRQHRAALPPWFKI
jgi:hypothetical protein